MKRIYWIYFNVIFCLISFQLFSQESISWKRSNDCDTTIKFKDSVEIKVGKWHCLSDPGGDQVLFFRDKNNFEKYIDENRITRDYCRDKPPMTFDFTKYDVLLIRLKRKGDSSYRIIEKTDCYVVHLDFFLKEGNTIEANSQNEIQVTTHLVFYTQYYLLPKGKINIPEFYIYDTFYKCF